MKLVRSTILGYAWICGDSLFGFAVTMLPMQNPGTSGIFGLRGK